MPKGVTNNPNGRKKGVPNKTTANIKELAGRYSHVCVEQLIKIATKSKFEGNRLAAIEQILNRAHGKPSQAIVGGDETDKPVGIRLMWERMPNAE